MGSEVLTTNIWRFVILVLVQGLVLTGIDFATGWLQHLHLFIYPVFVLLLPMRLPPVAVIGLGFGLGLVVDLFTNTIGMHAMAGSFLGLMRPVAFSLFAPINGYNTALSPVRRNMGAAWTIRYAAVMMAFFLLYFFSIEAFTFAYWGRILKNFAVSYPFSLAVVLLILLANNSRT